MISPALATVSAELDRLTETGRTVQVWWRDDDAAEATQALDRLLALARDTHVPLAVAAIPAAIHPSLAERLADEPGVRVLPHGFSHRDHAPSGEKRAEFGPHRHVVLMAEEAARGLGIVASAFGHRAMPVFVPPWNRADPALLPHLARAGFAGISCFGPAHLGACPALPAINAHLDPVDWHGSRSLAEPAAVARALRTSLESGTGPVGLLSHHLAFDEALWRFWSGLVERLALHPAVRFMAVDDLWPDRH